MTVRAFLSKLHELDHFLGETAIKERTKDVFVSVLLLLVGMGLGALALTVFGCGNGPGYLGLGLAIEAALDPAPEQGVPGEDGLPGLACWDLDGSGECDEEEDANSDGDCDATDCQGVAGVDGVDGEDSTVPGPQGEAGNDGITTVVIIRPQPVVVDEDNDPPHGHAYGHDKPKGKP